MENIYTVSQLTEQVRNALSAGLPFVWVKGEISNFTQAASGHIYFSLKDNKSQLQCVWFVGKQRSRAFDPLTGEVYTEQSPKPALANGIQVVCSGSIDVYAARGQYQLLVETAQPVGAGLLSMQFEERKKKLRAAGYFDKASKRPLPLNPRRVALITSPTGAAIRDFIKVAAGRGIGSVIRLFPAQVQGEGAADKIVAATNLANAQRWAQVIVLIRGGGSLEDLWTFNEEQVATAIFKSRLPVLAGIGHEVDFSLADMTADVRAATPSHAAQLLWSPQSEFWQRLDSLQTHMDRIANRRMEMAAKDLSRIANALKLLSPTQKLANTHEKLKWLEQQLQKNIGKSVEERKNRLNNLYDRLKPMPVRKIAICDSNLSGLETALRSLDPASPLQRGYALLFRNGHVVSSVEDIAPNSILQGLLKNGSLELNVTANKRETINSGDAVAERVAASKIDQ